MKRSSQAKRFRGFARTRTTREGVTLIEAMVAIAIVGMVMTLLWGGFSQTMKNKARIEENLDRHHVIHAALHRMSRELSMAFVSSHANPNLPLNKVITIFKGSDRGNRDRIDFCSFSHQRLFRNAHESDQNELSYFITTIDDPERGSVQVLARREQNRIDDQPDKGGRVQVLVEDVEGFNLEYLDPRDGEWEREWDTTQSGTGAPNLLPAQIKITIEVPHTSTIERSRGRTQTFGTRASLPLRYGLNHSIYNP